MKNTKSIFTAIAVLASVSTAGMACDDCDYSLQFTIVNNLTPNPDTSSDKVSLKFQAYSYKDSYTGETCYTSNTSDVELKQGGSESVKVKCKGKHLDSINSITLGFTYNTTSGGPYYTNLDLNPNNSKVTDIQADKNLSNVSKGDKLTDGMTIEFNN